MKYAVSNELASEIWRQSSFFLAPDRGMSTPQRITSLYLDGPDLPFLRWNLQGRSDRFKLRIRAYGNDIGPLVYAEIKSKTGSVVRKQRADIPVTLLTTLLGVGRPDPAFLLKTGDSSVVSEFVRRRQHFQAEPKMLITCLRRSLRKNGPGGEVAVTIDQHLKFQRTCWPDFASDSGKWHVLRLPGNIGSDGAIVEFKYINQPPGWMKLLILDFSSHRVRFSKYKTAMQQDERSARSAVQSALATRSHNVLNCSEGISI